ncbi:MAG: hypothetical protein V1899_10305 [Planctomycetota bacterium]
MLLNFWRIVAKPVPAQATRGAGHGGEQFEKGGDDHYVTFSCYKRRRLLNPDVCKRIVIGTLGSQLTRQNGICVGFVITMDSTYFRKENCMRKLNTCTIIRYAQAWSMMFAPGRGVRRVSGCEENPWGFRYHGHLEN